MALEEGHELMVIELGLKEVVERDGRTSARDLNAAQTTFDEEHADFIRGDGQVDLIVLFLGVAFVTHQDAFVGKGSCGVFERSEFRDSPGSLKFSLVVVLLGEGEEEPFFSGSMGTEISG